MAEVAERPQRDGEEFVAESRQYCHCTAENTKSVDVNNHDKDQ